jgi:hypothetical protein
MKNTEKIDQIFSEGEEELEKEKIKMRDLFKKTIVLVLKKLKFKNIKNIPRK